VRKDGSRFFAHVTMTALRGSEGGLRGFAKVTRDVTARRAAEEALRKSETQLRALAARVEAVREEQALHISREIHDELGQALTGLKVDAAWLASQLAKAGSQPGADLQMRLGSMVQAIDSTIETTRRICTELRPAVLDELGLTDALEWQAREFEARTGIFCNLSLAPGNEPELDAERATAVFRVFQEILTNIARHAEATEIDVRFETMKGGAMLRVADHGRGFAGAGRASHRGLGLLGMEERARAAGGTLEIQSGAADGTTVILRLPPSIA
jgi:signal transduction histidine kinase